MYLKEKTIETKHKRKSKLGTEHEYWRCKHMIVLRCDNCNREFERPRRSMDPKRLNNNYFHVCDQCDAKKFAQKKGVERRKIWNMTASSSLPISKL
jgi:hypothetical protein